MRERSLGQDVVGDPVRQLREGVRGARGDDEQVCPGQVLVDVLAARAPCQRQERLLGHEALRALGDERDHLVACLDEQARQLAGLVGRDAAGDAQEDPGHSRNRAYFFVLLGYS